MDSQGQTPAQPLATQSSAPQPSAPQPGPSIGERIHDFESHLPSLNQALSEIASFVPGFAGYKSTEDRRIADKQLRAVIGERLTSVKGRLSGIVDALTRSSDLDALALIDQSDRRLGRLIDRMRFADYGYAAVFDRVQMGDAELARIYAYDASIMNDLGAFDGAIDEIVKAGSDGAAIRAGLAKLDGFTADFDRRFEGRKHLFDGLPTA